MKKSAKIRYYWEKSNYYYISLTIFKEHCVSRPTELLILITFIAHGILICQDAKILDEKLY